MVELERRTGKGFGSVENPLLVSVRSGARVSMPGMMDTILNLGLNDCTVEGLAKLTGNDRFACDAYRRFITMFSSVVLGIDKEHFEHLLDAAKAARLKDRSRSWRRRLEASRRTFKDVVAHKATASFRRTCTNSSTSRSERCSIPGIRSGDRLSPYQQDLGRVGHGGQRRLDGVRQHGRRFGDGRRVYARSEHGRARALRRVSSQRAGRGRRRRHSHARKIADLPIATRRLRAIRRDRESARNALPRHAGSRSFPSSAASSTCCRRAAASAAPKRRSRSRWPFPPTA